MENIFSYFHFNFGYFLIYFKSLIIFLFHTNSYFFVHNIHNILTYYKQSRAIYVFLNFTILNLAKIKI